MARIFVLALLLTLTAADAFAAKPGMSWRDIVQVRKVYSPIISDETAPSTVDHALRWRSPNSGPMA